MARGSAGKARRKEERKDAKLAEAERMLNDGHTNDFDNDDNMSLPTPYDTDKRTKSDSDSSDDESKPIVVKKKKRNVKNTQDDNHKAACCPQPSQGKGIKTLPLVMLLMLMGTTVLPFFLYAGDWISGFIAKNHVTGKFGHKFGIGASPKKRVVSFYEKHEPSKISEVENILAKYYGDYPKLVKRLERKYSDYGYFLGWEEDEAPMTLAKEKLIDTRDYIQKQFDIYAPRKIKTASRNIKYNLTTLYKKFRNVWKKTIYPVLEKFIGVPDGVAAQKKKDRMDTMKAKGRRKKNTDYRDDEF